MHPPGSPASSSTGTLALGSSFSGADINLSPSGISALLPQCIAFIRGNKFCECSGSSVWVGIELGHTAHSLLDFLSAFSYECQGISSKSRK